MSDTSEAIEELIRQGKVQEIIDHVHALESKLRLIEAMRKQELQWRHELRKRNDLLESRVEIINLFAKCLPAIMQYGETGRHWADIRIPFRREMNWIVESNKYDDYFEYPNYITIKQISMRYNEIQQQLQGEVVQ